MGGADAWIDLLDPSPEELRGQLPVDLHESALEQLRAPPRHDDEPRPKLEGHGKYAFGVFLVAVVVPHEDYIYYQEIDVILTHDRLFTIRKTPEGRKPFDSATARQACRAGDSVGMVMYHLVDDIAEAYLDLVDDVNDEIDELEDNIEIWSDQQIRERLSLLRHDLLHIRRTLGPMRDAVRNIVDDRIDLEGEEAFPRDVELAFGAAYDKFLRAADGLELSRDLVAGVRDYHQAKTANEQNEVMKRLTVVASLLFVPAVIAGIYGQNFRDMPELRWQFGYLWSWGWIVGLTILQLVYFRRKRWL